MHAYIRNIDLNLLPIFDAVYRHRSVISAANELAISPSTLSHSLAKLRGAFADALFVRQGNGMQPTPRAEELAIAISGSLSNLSSFLDICEPFDPVVSSRQFTFAATDYTASIILPALIARLQRVAPLLTICILDSNKNNVVEELRTGKVDFAIGLEGDEAPVYEGLGSVELLRDNYLVAVRQGNSIVRDELSLQQFQELGHVVVRSWSEPQRAIDNYLLQEGVSQKIAIELPGVIAAPLIISSTDLAITLPQRGIEQLFDIKKLKVFQLPFTIPDYILKLYFMTRKINIDRYLWMKEQIILSIK